MNRDIFDAIKRIVPEEDILLLEPMSAHTTFRTGGPAEALIKISDAKQPAELIPYLNQIEAPYFIKGNGSNLLVSDRGYEGIVLEFGEKFQKINVEGTKIRAEAGASMAAIANQALKNSLTGFEFASGIPGTIGGGVCMNAGAYDGECKDVVETVSVLTERGEILTIRNGDMEFGYRKSILKERPFVVLEVTLELTPGDPEKIREKMAELNAKRREKQPLEYPSAGSTFKRPEGYFAGKLIMDTGLRGFSIGGAAVSEKHCGFIVNKGRASSADIYEVIQEVKEKVYDRFGVTLEPEVVFLGQF